MPNGKGESIGDNPELAARLAEIQAKAESKEKSGELDDQIEKKEAQLKENPKEKESESKKSHSQRRGQRKEPTKDNLSEQVDAIIDSLPVVESSSEKQKHNVEELILDFVGTTIQVLGSVSKKTRDQERSKQTVYPKVKFMGEYVDADIVGRKNSRGWSEERDNFRNQVKDNPLQQVRQEFVIVGIESEIAKGGRKKGEEVLRVKVSNEELDIFEANKKRQLADIQRSLKMLEEIQGLTWQYQVESEATDSAEEGVDKEESHE